MASSLYTKFVSKFLFPLHERLKKHNTTALLKELESTQWYSEDQLQTLQQEKLQRFIKKIFLTVPFYQQMLQDLGLQPTDIKSIADLRLLPFLTKDVIRANFPILKATDAVGLKRFNTGGSSGQPLVFLLGNERVSHDVATKWRATRWWHVDIGDKEIVAWGSPIELSKQDKIKIWRDKFFRTTLIPAFDMTEQKLLAFIAQIKATRPAMLFGYPSVFHLIAKTALAHQLDLTQLGIKVVFVTSERLYPYQREMIEQVFAAPVANGYGGRDAGFIAHQCPNGGMHISAEDIIVEIIDRDGQVLPAGEQGEIVITHLATSEFPFVRYRTGDIASISRHRCSCGRGLPLLENLEGRTTDFVVAADGTMMHGLALIYVIRELPGISNFKLIQESLTLLRVQLVLDDPTDHSQLPLIRQGLIARLGQSVTIEFELLSEISSEASGKYRYVISKVSS
jgi:phenylacetate-CoA ligase